MKTANIGILGSFLFFMSMAGAADFCPSLYYPYIKPQIKRTLPQASREEGLIQITGKDLVPGQVSFPKRTPADPFPFYDEPTGEILIYGTGSNYLRSKNANELFRNKTPETLHLEIFLPNGERVPGAEDIWDIYRLSYRNLESVFSKEVLEASYRSQGLDPESDLFFGGVALQEDGSMGRWPIDNWRRRIHPMGRRNGRMQLFDNPVFNQIPGGKTESAYVGFGRLPHLPGDYIGHAYGPNFKLVRNGSKLELWLISEEVVRRIDEGHGPAEVTEIIARKMISPFEASTKPEDRVVLLTVNGRDGKPHPDSDRGPEMGHTKLLEGFRPISLSPEGVRITKRAVLIDGKEVLVEDPSLANEEYHVLLGSSGNFAGDGYDVRLAWRKGSAIGPYRMTYAKNRKSWKSFLDYLKERFRLSWAGRGVAIEERPKSNLYRLLFQAADKDIKPEGSYSGVIPPNPHEYHRNLYGIAIEFYINLHGEVDMKLIGAEP